MNGKVQPLSLLSLDDDLGEWPWQYEYVEVGPDGVTSSAAGRQQAAIGLPEQRRSLTAN